MRRGPHWIAHVVQGVEDTDEVVALAREVLRAGHLEADAVADPRALGGALCRLDRRGVVIEADELGVRVGLGHHDRRGAVSAPDVGDPSPRQQLLLDALERGQPRRDEVGDVAGPEEQLGAAEEVAVVLLPPEALAGAEALGDLGFVAHARRGDVERARKKRRALRVGQAGGLLRGQEEALALGVVLDIAAGGLRAQPLAHVALVGVRARRELRRRDGLAVAHRGVEPQLVADEDGRLMKRCAKVTGEASYELLQSPFVEGGSLTAMDVPPDNEVELVDEEHPQPPSSARQICVKQVIGATWPTRCRLARCWSSACSAGSPSPMTTGPWPPRAAVRRSAGLAGPQSRHAAPQSRGGPPVARCDGRERTGSLRTALLDLAAHSAPPRTGT